MGTGARSRVAEHRFVCRRTPLSLEGKFAVRILTPLQRRHAAQRMARILSQVVPTAGSKRNGTRSELYSPMQLFLT